MMRQVVEQFGDYAKLNKKLGEEAAEQLGDIDDAGELADTIAAAINAKVSDKQALLVERDPLKRLEMVIGLQRSTRTVASFFVTVTAAAGAVAADAAIALSMQTRRMRTPPPSEKRPTAKTRRQKDHPVMLQLQPRQKQRKAPPNRKRRPRLL